MDTADMVQLKGTGPQLVKEYDSRGSCKSVSPDVANPFVTADPEDKDAAWVNGDVRPGQEDRYALWLKKWSHDLDVMGRELSECCQFNLTNKLSILCSHLINIGVGLNLDIYETKSCLIYATGSDCKEVSKLIIQSADRELLMYEYRGKEYDGCTALHCAVANEMTEVIDDMFKKLDKEDIKKLMSAQLLGKYFIDKLNVTSLVQHIACWNGNIEIFEKLVYHGVEVDAKDYPRGNTILHVLVELGVEFPDLASKTFEAVFKSQASRQWYSMKMNQDLTQWTAQDDVNFKTHMLYITNNDGYTPLTLAAKLGARSMIDFIVNIEGVHRMTFWRFGRVSFVGYDMTEVDPGLAQKDCTIKPNVMDLLIFQSLNTKTLPVFSLPVIQNWVMNKWKYYRYNFYIWSICHLFFMMAIYQIPVKFMTESLKAFESMNNTLNSTGNATDICFCDIIWKSRSLQLYVSVACCYIFIIMCFELYEVGLSLLVMFARLTRQWHNKMYNALMPVIFKFTIFKGVLLISMVGQILMLLSLFVESTVCGFSTAIAFAFGCYFYLFFLQACQSMGYFGTIMHHVLFTDIISFGYVFIIMLVAFGGTMTIVLFNENHDAIGFNELGISVFTMFNYMQGFGSVPYFRNVTYSYVVITVFVVFICLTIILLLNMLIAAMSETYAKLAPHRDLIWTRNMASAILMMERRAFPWQVNNINRNILQFDDTKRRWLLMVETSQPATCTK